MSKWAEYRAWKTTGGKTSSQQPHTLRHRITRRRDVSGRAVLLPTRRMMHPARTEATRVRARTNNLTNLLHRRKVEANPPSTDRARPWVRVALADAVAVAAAACLPETAVCAGAVGATAIVVRLRPTIGRAIVRPQAAAPIRKVSAKRPAIRMFHPKNARSSNKRRRK
jgi:hypothetical protein